MFDPTMAYLASAHQPGEELNNLDLEQYALRHGHVVRMPAPATRISVRFGRLLIQMGEKLTGESHPIEFSREML